MDEPIINYPTNPDGSLVTRGIRGGVPPLPDRAPAAAQPGSVHWAATYMFGGPERFVQVLESIVAGQGQLAEAEWQRACVLYREWQRRHRAGLLKREPNLNDVAHVLKLNTEEFFGKIALAVQGLFSKIAVLKAAQLLPEAIQLTGEAMKDLEHGVKDRELILKIGGVIADKPGLVINNANQFGVQMGEQKQLNPALSQFRETAEQVDEAVRTAAVERAALPPADMTNVVEGELVEPEKVEVRVHGRTDEDTDHAGE